MTLPSVSTRTSYLHLMNYVGNLQSQMLVAQKEVSTQKKYDVSGYYGERTSILIGMRNDLQQTDKFMSSIDMVANRLDVAQTAMEKMQDLAQKISTQTLSAIHTDNVAPRYVQASARGTLDQVLQYLSTQADGQYLFSGTGTSMRTMQDPTAVNPVSAATPNAAILKALNANNLGTSWTTADVAMAVADIDRMFQDQAPAAADNYTNTVYNGASPLVRNAGSVTAPAIEASPIVGGFGNVTPNNSMPRAIRLDDRTPVPGETYSLTVNGNTVSYTAAPADTIDNVGSALATAVAGIPVTPAYTVGAWNPTSKTFAITSGAGNQPISAATTSPRTITLGNRTPVAGETYKIDFGGTAVSYTVKSGDTIDSVGTALQAAAGTIPGYTAAAWSPVSKSFDVTLGAGTTDITVSATSPNAVGMSATLDRGYVMKYGMTGDDQAVRLITQGLYMLSSVDFTQVPPNVYKEYADAANQRLTEGMDLLTKVRADQGIRQKTLEDTKAMHETSKTLLNNTITTWESVDPYEASTRLTLLQTQLEAAYRTTSKVTSMSLVNYLS